MHAGFFRHFLVRVAVTALSACGWVEDGNDATTGDVPDGGPGPVSIEPSSATTNPLGSLTFTARVGGDPTIPVEWKVAEGPTGGTITPSGRYTAPWKAGKYTVVATVRDDPSRFATVTVTSVDAPEIIESQSGIIGPDGGVVVLSSDLGLVLPAGAVESPVQATIARVGSHPVFADDQHVVLNITFSDPVGSAFVVAAIEPGQPPDGFTAARLDPDIPRLIYLAGEVIESGTVFAADLASDLSGPKPLIVDAFRAPQAPLTGATVVLEKPGIPPPVATVGPIATPYCEQFVEGSCWAAVWLAFLKAYGAAKPGYDSIHALERALGVEKAEGLSSDVIRAVQFPYYFGDSLQSTTATLLGRKVERMAFLNVDVMIHWVTQQLDQGRIVLALLMNHAGLFVGYDVDPATQQVRLFYHDPQGFFNDHAYNDPETGALRTGPARTPYRFVTRDDLYEEFFHTAWYATWVNWAVALVAETPPAGIAPLQTIQLPWPDTDSRSSAAFQAGIGFANKQNMVATLQWDHTVPSGYRTEPSEVPPDFTDMLLRAIPTWNADLEAETTGQVKVALHRFSGPVAEPTPYWESSPIPVHFGKFDFTNKAASRAVASLTVPASEVIRGIESDDRRVAAIVSFTSGATDVRDRFDVDFRIGPPIVKRVTPGSARWGDKVTIEGFGFGEYGSLFSGVYFMSSVPPNHIKATEVEYWTDRTIRVAVPLGAATGALQIGANVHQKEVLSNPVDFTVEEEEPKKGTLCSVDVGVWATMSDGSEDTASFGMYPGMAGASPVVEGTQYSIVYDGGTPRMKGHVTLTRTPGGPIATLDAAQDTYSLDGTTLEMHAAVQATGIPLRDDSNGRQTYAAWGDEICAAITSLEYRYLGVQAVSWNCQHGDILLSVVCMTEQ